MFRKITVMLGVVLVLISSIGLLMGSMALLSVSPATQSNMNEAAYNTAMQNMQQDMKETPDNISYDDFQRTMDSPEFKRYVFGMAGFGFLLNLLLLVSSILLIRESPKGFYVMAGAGAAVGIYWHGMTSFAFDGRIDPNNAMDPLAAAWGVGNMGLVLLELSYFWIWGPLVAISMLLWLRSTRA